MNKRRAGLAVAILSATVSPWLEVAAWSRPRPHTRLRLKGHSGLVRNPGALLSRPVVARTDQPRPAQSQLTLPPSFIAFHSDRVRRDLLIFHAAATGGDPALPGDRSDRPYGFVAPPRSEDPLAELRLRDRLLLFEPPRNGAAATGTGLALFGAATVAAAHAPAPLRLVFDGPVRVGPAIFSDGGMGVGVGGSAP